MPESELRRLEPVLTSAAELHYWTSEVEQKEAELAPPSALADLQAKKAKAEKEKPSKHARNKQKMQEEAR